eukprot:13614938-Heterocapsa_arctica.AAC.1
MHCATLAEVRSITCTLTDRLPKLERVSMRDGGSGPQTIKVSMSVVLCLEKNKQGSYRAEVRALVAALETSEETIDIITDNQYVRDTAQYLAAGGIVHKGEHSDLWTRIKIHTAKLGHIRWVKVHLKEEKASAAGVSYDDWFGNKQADLKAKE